MNPLAGLSWERKVLVVVAVVAITLAGIFASKAGAASLHPGEAKAATAVGLQRFYGYRWTEAEYKEIERPYCYSASHCQTRWHFEPVGGGYCYGDVITWRDRYGELWYHVRVSPEDHDSRCR